VSFGPCCEGKGGGGGRNQVLPIVIKISKTGFTVTEKVSLFVYLV
jgi:hypothetical protein